MSNKESKVAVEQNPLDSLGEHPVVISFYMEENHRRAVPMTLDGLRATRDAINNYLNAHGEG